MKLNIVEWNIHGAASFPWENNFEIKKWIVDEIMVGLPDIIVLTEFVVSKGWDYFQEILEKNDYRWFMSNNSGTNGIFIAIKNREEFNFQSILNYESESINTEKILRGIDLPDFYEIKFAINHIKVSIIGLRIRKDINKTNKKFFVNQFKSLDLYLSNIKDNVICVGDFNAYWANSWNDFNKNFTLPNTSKNYNIFTPKYNCNNGFSFVQLNGDKTQLDHLITNLKICKKTEIVKYDWDFLCDKNGYKGFSKDSPRKPRNLPDHAILRCIFEW